MKEELRYSTEVILVSQRGIKVIDISYTNVLVSQVIIKGVVYISDFSDISKNFVCKCYIVDISTIKSHL